MNSNIPNLILMIRPKHFGFNEQTAGSNSFQNNVSENVSGKAQLEFDQAVQLLQNKKIELKVFEDQDRVLPDAVFPNNWISHVPGKGIVVYPMLTPNRQDEVRFDIVDWMLNEMDEGQVIDLRDSGLILEGTGSIVFDHKSKKAFACVSPRTDLKLLDDLCRQLGYQSISFEALDLEGEQIYHTNVVMSIGEDMAIICLECIPDLIERSMVKQALISIGKEIVDISYQQMNQFAGNAMEVVNINGDRFYVMSSTAYRSLTSKQLDQIGKSSSILQIDIPTIENVGGGSIRCMMAGFFNYPK